MVGGAVGGVFAAILMLLVVGVIISLVVFVTRRRKRADKNNTISNAIYDGKNIYITSLNWPEGMLMYTWTYQ